MCSCSFVSLFFAATIESSPQTPLRFLCADGVILKHAFFCWKLNILDNGPKPTGSTVSHYMLSPTHFAQSLVSAVTGVGFFSFLVGFSFSLGIMLIATTRTSVCSVMFTPPPVRRVTGSLEEAETGRLTQCSQRGIPCHSKPCPV